MPIFNSEDTYDTYVVTGAGDIGFFIYKDGDSYTIELRQIKEGSICDPNRDREYPITDGRVHIIFNCKESIDTFLYIFSVFRKIFVDKINPNTFSYDTFAASNKSVDHIISHIIDLYLSSNEDVKSIKKDLKDTSKTLAWWKLKYWELYKKYKNECLDIAHKERIK